jgi:hypothetical protein
MVKAKEFWGCLCDNFDFRFFSGVPCRGLSALYNTMKKDFLHYVPASNEQMAIGLVNGAFLAGFNSAALIDINKISKLDVNFNLSNNVPLLIITSGKNYNNPLYNVNLTDDYAGSLSKITKYISTKLKPGVLFVEDGLLI